MAEQRYRAVLEVGAEVPVTEVAERYGVSRQSVHTWLLRYRQEGIAGLEDRSHQVHNHPWRIPAEVEEVICELRRSLRARASRSHRRQGLTRENGESAALKLGWSTLKLRLLALLIRR